MSFASEFSTDPRESAVKFKRDVKFLRESRGETGLQPPKVMFRSIFTSVLVLAVAGAAAAQFLSQHVATPAPSPAVAPAPASTGLGRTSLSYGQISIAPDAAGNYVTDVEIDGRPIHMVVDTGATYVSLTNADADAVGIRPAPADYVHRIATANGTGVAARVRIDRLQIGSMEIDDVDAFVLPAGALATSLLGMSALNRFGGVEMSNGMLVLRQ